MGDFGIARELDRTMSGLSKKGTFSYMAPEMYRGEAYDARVDIYSLGIVLYKLRNHNRLPFISLKKQLITYRDKEEALNRRMAGRETASAGRSRGGFCRSIFLKPVRMIVMIVMKVRKNFEWHWSRFCIQDNWKCRKSESLRLHRILKDQENFFRNRRKNRGYEVLKRTDPQTRIHAGVILQKTETDQKKEEV